MTWYTYNDVGPSLIATCFSNPEGFCWEFLCRPGDNVVLETLAGLRLGAPVLESASVTVQGRSIVRSALACVLDTRIGGGRPLTMLVSKVPAEVAA